MNLHPNVEFTLKILFKVLLIVIPLFYYLQFSINPYFLIVYEIIMVVLFLLPIQYQSKILANVENVTNRLPVSTKCKRNIISTIKRIIF
jgi:hypothetical protein